MDKVNIKKLWPLALYSSPVISALVVTPLFIVTSYRFVDYPVALFWILLLVFFTWAINIGLAVTCKKAITRYALSYLFCVLVTVLIVQHLFGHMHGNASDGKVFHFHFIVFFSINTAVLILLDLALVKEKNTLVERENAFLKLKNMEAANQQLKHQLQPHFLFNSLSTLKALIKTSPENAEEYLVKLSEFLRYSISTGRLNTIKIDEEIKLCVNYLAMQQIRFANALHYTIDIPAEVVENKYVPVFALQVLVENAIKHNTFTIAAPLYIIINYNDGIVTVSNNLQPNASNEMVAGTGLANLNERYIILSGEDIVIQKTETTFAVSIKVLDDENSDNRG